MADGDQPATPGKKKTTPTTARLSPPSGQRKPQKQKPSTTPTSAFGQGLTASATGGDDIGAKVDDLRRRILSGEDVSLGSVGEATVLDDVPGYGLGGNQSHRTVNDLLNDLTSFDRPEIEALQRQLFQAGYFPDAFYSDSKANPVEWGNRFDQATRRAYGLLLTDGISYKGLSIDKILADRTEDFTRTGRTAGGNRVSRDGILGGGKLYQTVLDDPASLKLAAEDLGQRILGRKPTGAKLQEYVAMIQGLQAKEQAATNAAEEANTRRNFDADVAHADSNVAGKAAGALRNPVAGGNFSDTMGADRDGGARKHKGTDIFAPEGTAVTAMVGGQIVKAGNDGGNGGNRVWVKGDDGRFYYYAHLQSITLKAGRVEPGQQLGTVGKTGNASSTAPHLHVSINSQMGAEDAIGNPALEIAGTGTATTVQHNAADTYLAPTNVTTTKVDASARLAEQIRKDNPDEAAAHDLANQYEEFRSIIGATRGSV